MRRSLPPWAWAGVAWAGSLAVYLATLSPSLPPGHDSGELITAAWLPGIAHPPGYPLYTMLGHLFTRLPWGDPAWRVNLMAAWWGAAAVGFCAAACARSARSDLAGLAAAGCFAFALTPWRLSVGAEVFSLHLALQAALLWAALEWAEASPQARPAWMGLQAGLLGLGLAHHHTIVLALPGLLSWWWLRRGSGWGLSWWMAPALAVGLSAYLYLPLRALGRPGLNWGCPDTLERWWWVVSRAGYGSLSLSAASGSEPALGFHLAAWARSLCVDQFPCGLAALGLWGLGLALSGRRPAGLLWGGLALTAGPIWAWIGAQPRGEGYLDMMERFYASSYLGFAGLVALGVAEGLRRLPPRAAWLALALPLASLAWNLESASERGRTLVRDSWEVMAAGLPPGALLVTGSDLTSGLALYGAWVEGRAIHPLPVGLVGSEWFLAQQPEALARDLAIGGLARALVQARARAVPVYLDHLPAGLSGFFVPEGLLFRYLAPGEPLPDRVQASRRSLALLGLRPQAGAPAPGVRPPFWHRHLERCWGYAYATAGEGLLAEDPQASLGALLEAVKMEPGNPGHWALLGEARLALGQRSEAVEAFSELLRLEPGSDRGRIGLRRAGAAGP